MIMTIPCSINLELTMNEIYNCAYDIAQGRRRLKIRDMDITITEETAQAILVKSEEVTKQFSELIRGVRGRSND